MEDTKDKIPAVFKIHGDNIGSVLFRTNVAGTTFVDGSDKVLRFLRDKVSPDGILVKLEREPENQYDHNAVKVNVSVKGAKKYFRLGYIPKDKSPSVSYALRNDSMYRLNIFDISIIGGDAGRENCGMFFSYTINKIL